MTTLGQEKRRFRPYSMSCTLMRAGTSKGIFIHRRSLPEDEAQWPAILISALGSRGGDPRQIDGVGGGTSTTSKVAIVSPSARPEADVDFTFAQVAVGMESVDFTGTCGNITAGVGPFSVQEGILQPRPGEKQMDIRIYNTNTRALIIETIKLDERGEYLEEGDHKIAGVSNTGSEVKCTFADPAGSMTGKLFPSGKTKQLIHVQPPASLPELKPFSVNATLIDAANPFVLVDSSSIAAHLEALDSPDSQYAFIEAIRREGAVLMGLSTSVESAAKIRGTPKIAILSPPTMRAHPGHVTPNVHVQSYSMGLPHPNLQLTGAVCLAAATCVKGTVASDISESLITNKGGLMTSSQSPSQSFKMEDLEEMDVVIEHCKGSLLVKVVMSGSDVIGTTVSRTARRLFQGRVWYYLE